MKNYTSTLVQITWDIIREEHLDLNLSFFRCTKENKQKIIRLATHEAHLIITEVKLELENCGYMNFTEDDENRLAEARKHLQKMLPWYKRLFRFF